MSQLCRSVQVKYECGNSRGRYEKLATAIHVSQNTGNLVISRSCFADDGYMKCSKNQNVRAEPLLCSLNLLFCDVLVGVAVVVC